MCGIAGWFSEHAAQRQDAVEKLNRMLAMIAHRGPDGDGFIAFDHAGLCHARLSIIDLSGGHQPMKHPNLPIYISFNGEIYNYKEIRQQLIGKGSVFHTHSDTEVLLNLYAEYGYNGFQQLRGMYAFALWDETNRTGLLVRDPLGIKPLFFLNHPEYFLFASEAKAIVAAEPKQACLDEAALHLLFNFRYLPGEYSLFKHIKQLAPGDILQWQNGAIKTHRLDLLGANYPAEMSPIAVLRESVKAHLVSDVQVGCYLSGGVDSAAIAQLANEQQAIQSFTVNVGDDPAEAKNALRSAQLLGIPNIQASVDCDLSSQLKRLVWHLEIPKINALQVSLLAQLTAPHVKVALSGLGGDELFYGYNAHKIIYLTLQIQRYTPKIIYQQGGRFACQLLILLNYQTDIPWTESERAMHMLQHLGNWPKVYGLLRNLWDSPYLRQSIYGERLLVLDLPDAFEVLEQLWPKKIDPLAAMAQFEWRQKMVNDLLWQEDRVSMAEGLEVRVPFVDSYFAQQIQAMGREQLMPLGKRKAYFYQLLREILPDEIIRRPKSGFQVNAVSFFHGQLGEIADMYLSPSTIRKHGLFNEKFVQKVLSKTPHKRLRWHYFILYLMLLTHIWLELFETQ